MNCKQYQDDLAARAINDSAARRTTNLLKVSYKSKMSEKESSVKLWTVLGTVFIYFLILNQ